MDYTLSTAWTTVLIIAALWDLFWRGWGLWRAGRRNQPVWFVVMLVINSLGIIPIIYLLTHQQEHTNENN